jgi:hypothetical protein
VAVKVVQEGQAEVAVAVVVVEENRVVLAQEEKAVAVVDQVRPDLVAVKVVPEGQVEADVVVVVVEEKAVAVVDQGHPEAQKEVEIKAGNGVDQEESRAVVRVQEVLREGQEERRAVVQAQEVQEVKRVVDRDQVQEDLREVQEDLREGQEERRAAVRVQEVLREVQEVRRAVVRVQVVLLEDLVEVQEVQARVEAAEVEVAPHHATVVICVNLPTPILQFQEHLIHQQELRTLQTTNTSQCQSRVHSYQELHGHLHSQTKMLTPLAKDLAKREQIQLTILQCQEQSSEQQM